MAPRNGPEKTAARGGEPARSDEKSGNKPVHEVRLGRIRAAIWLNDTDAGPRYNNAGFWDLPIPVTKDIDVHPDDVVVYDRQGYAPLKAFLQKHGVRHVLLTGYATDMCFARTTAGYENLAKDFNVFLVGDATLATFPANATPRFATNAAVSFASLNHLITQVSWVKWVGAE